MLLEVMCYLLKRTVREFSSPEDKVDIVHHFTVEYHISVRLIARHKLIETAEQLDD